MITSQLEIIEQAQLYLSTVSKSEYTSIVSPNFISSAGAHMRHIIDHYIALSYGIEKGLIDYDIRSRASKLEVCPSLAKDKLTEISTWIKTLTTDDLNKVVMLTTEVSITNKNIQKVQTSIARELIFVSSHAVHHYAMITQISFAIQARTQQEFSLNKPFGLAPATATFMRQGNKVNGKN